MPGPKPGSGGRPPKNDAASRPRRPPTTRRALAREALAWQRRVEGGPTTGRAIPSLWAGLALKLKRLGASNNMIGMWIEVCDATRTPDAQVAKVDELACVVYGKPAADGVRSAADARKNRIKLASRYITRGKELERQQLQLLQVPAEDLLERARRALEARPLLIAHDPPSMAGRCCLCAELVLNEPAPDGNS